MCSWKENHVFAVTETKKVCRFLPAVKTPDGLTMKITLLCGGEEGILAPEDNASSDISV